MVVLVVEPAMLPGLIVHEPAGSPVSSTEPVGVVHVGCDIVLMAGAEGLGGTPGIVAVDEVPDTQPAELVTVKLYEPGSRAETVVPVPVPVEVTAPGRRVNVQPPVDGNPDNTTLPVGDGHVGAVIVPITGGVGVAGWVFITTNPDAGEVHCDNPSVTV